MREYRETKKVEKQIEEVSAACNKCGKKFEKNKSDLCWDAQLHNFGVSGGYGSEYDMESFDFDLCEECVNELVKTFMIVPNGFKMGSFVYPKHEHHQKVFNNWKVTGEWEALMYCTYEELVELNGHLKREYLNEIIHNYHPGKELLQESEREIKRNKLLKGLI